MTEDNILAIISVLGGLAAGFMYLKYAMFLEQEKTKRQYHLMNEKEHKTMVFGQAVLNLLSGPGTWNEDVLDKISDHAVNLGLAEFNDESDFILK